MSKQISTNELVQGESLYGFGQQRIIETSDGILYSCQINSSGYIEVYVSTNEGASWTLDATFADVTNPLMLSMTKSENNDIFLSFVENINNGIVKRKNYSTGEWSTVFSETRQSNASLPISCVAYYYEDIHRLFVFIYSNYRNTTEGPTFNNLYNYYSDDFGSTWSDVAGGVGITNTTLKSGAIFGITHYNVTFTITVIYHLSDVGTDSLGGNIAEFNLDGSYKGFLMNIYAYGVTGGCCAVGLNSYYISVRKYSTAANGFYIYKENNSSIIASFTFGATFPCAMGEWCAGCDNKGNLYIFYVKIADGICYFRKYNSVTSVLSDEEVFSKDSEGNPIEGRRPSCVQSVINSGNKLRVIYTTS